MLAFLLALLLPSAATHTFHGQRRTAEPILGRALETLEVTSQQAQQTVRKTLSRVEEQIANLERRLQNVVDDPAFLLQSARRAILDESDNLFAVFARLPRSICSQLSWRRTSRLIRHGGIEDLTGSWSITERHGMVPPERSSNAGHRGSADPHACSPQSLFRAHVAQNEFLKSLGFNPCYRAAVLQAGQVQVIRRQGRYLHIVTRDIRGTSELVLPLDGQAVSGEGDGAEPIDRRAYVERGSDAIVITEMKAGEAQPLSVCRRSLQDDGRMRVDVRKRTKSGDLAQMRIVFSPVGCDRPEAWSPDHDRPDA